MKKKEFSTVYIIICFILAVGMALIVGIFGTMCIADTLAYRGCAENEEKLYLIAFVIEQEDDCRIVEVTYHHDKGKVTFLAQPNDGGEPYLINLEVKGISPFVYEWMVTEE